jgi:RNA polymerase sigma factor (sigma-70 family)
VSASDNHLLNQAASGDRHALVQLLEQHGPPVRRRIEGRIPRRWRSALSADDIMQQTYIDAFVDADRLVANGKGSFPKWLGSLAKCNLLDAIKMLEADKRGKGRPRIELRTREDSFIALHELIGSAHSTPSQHVARDEACDALERAVRQLPEVYRRVVEMYDLADRPVEEVARELERSPGAVYMVRARAHRWLRDIMGRESQYLSTT